MPSLGTKTDHRVHTASFGGQHGRGRISRLGAHLGSMDERAYSHLQSPLSPTHFYNCLQNLCSWYVPLTCIASELCILKSEGPGSRRRVLRITKYVEQALSGFTSLLSHTAYLNSLSQPFSFSNHDQHGLHKLKSPSQK